MSFLPPDPTAASVDPSSPGSRREPGGLSAWTARESWYPVDWRRLTHQQIFAAGLVAAPLAAVALGMGLGPRLDAHRPMEPVSQERMRIVLASTQNTPVPMAPGAPLQVMPPGVAGPTPPAIPARPIAATGLGADTADVVPVAAHPSDTEPTVPATRDCGAEPSAAARMICSDDELSAADQRMRRAWRRAMAAGASADDLRRDQNDWLAAREDAARESPQAVRALYAQRIKELEEAADEAGDNNQDN